MRTLSEDHNPQSAISFSLLLRTILVSALLRELKQNAQQCVIGSLGK
jgi:hypothetical protein